MRSESTLRISCLEPRYSVWLSLLRGTSMPWEIAVKYLHRVRRVGVDEIVYTPAKRYETSTWRFEDIEKISSSGPPQLTITTFEDAKTHSDNRREFSFELNQRLEEARYNDLWLRLNRSRAPDPQTRTREEAGAQYCGAPVGQQFPLWGH